MECIASVHTSLIHISLMATLGEPPFSARPGRMDFGGEQDVYNYDRECKKWLGFFSMTLGLALTISVACLSNWISEIFLLLYCKLQKYMVVILLLIEVSYLLMSNSAGIAMRIHKAATLLVERPCFLRSGLNSMLTLPKPAQEFYTFPSSMTLPGPQLFPHSCS